MHLGGNTALVLTKCPPTSIGSPRARNSHASGVPEEAQALEDVRWSEVTIEAASAPIIRRR